jgi:hypothetical protein
MNFQWEDGDVMFGELDEFWTELLRRLPESAATQDEPARKRLFGGPTAGTDPEADEEWREVVEPELEELFQSHIDVVSSDLQNLRVIDGESTLRIPADHLRAWVHTLNQARLAIGARNGITEDDMEGRRAFDTQEKGFAMLQIEVYGLVLGFLLRHTEL